MNVYILTREGIYRHEILGVYENRDDATAAANVAIRAEEDSYHSILLSCAPVGEVLEDATPLGTWYSGERGYPHEKGEIKYIAEEPPESFEPKIYAWTP